MSVKAEDVVVLDLRRISYSFDFFVLVSGSSSIRIKTISEEVEEKLSEQGEKPGHREGNGQSGWVLLDYGMVVFHIFSPEAREFYRLEKLWADAPHVPIGNHRREA